MSKFSYWFQVVGWIITICCTLGTLYNIERSSRALEQIRRDAGLPRSHGHE